MAAVRAFLCSCRPRYWETTTAPPVASAEKIWISRILMESTNDIPETAASPAEVTITVSAIPTAIARNCSTISGTMSLRSICREKSFCWGTRVSLGIECSFRYYDLLLS